MAQVLIVSDLHYASEGEKARANNDWRAAPTLPQKIITRTWGHYFWLRDPFGHNHRLSEIVEKHPAPDWVVVNGDYTVDTAFVGVSDGAAFASASQCLMDLRKAWPRKLLLNIGDHDLGKKSLFGGIGGLRLKSLQRMVGPLDVPLAWVQDIGHFRLIGLASSVAALAVFREEILPAEYSGWEDAHHQLLSSVREAFLSASPKQRILLFVHDPSALPTLYRERTIRERLGQIEATVIGHLHSPAVLKTARMLAGFPSISWLGHTTRRYSRALRESRCWREFKVILCPSPTGMQIFKDGGYLVASLPEKPGERVRIEKHRLPWNQS
ncbi:MAG TPA: metallophosphoesterase [Candidatus Limnocylindria bacterium]|nr:metallophosphoesterase [Candidatus Limnocylindria bacterium]